jgi:hypothetical protein
VGGWTTTTTMKRMMMRMRMRLRMTNDDGWIPFPWLVAGEVMAVLQRFCLRVEKASIDEAYLDLTAGTGIPGAYTLFRSNHRLVEVDPTAFRVRPTRFWMNTILCP